MTEENTMITSDNNTPTEEVATPEVKTYTQDEVLKLLQAETDKRVSQALKTQQKKHEKELSLSKLDDEARARAEKDDRIAELEEQLAQFTIERNRSELKSVLSSRGLSAEFADIINITDDIESSQANIDALDKLFKAAVRAEVEKRLSGSTPKGNGSTVTVADKQSMSIKDLQMLKATNPEAYQNLYK